MWPNDFLNSFNYVLKGSFVIHYNFIIKFILFNFIIKFILCWKTNRNIFYSIFQFLCIPFLIHSAKLREEEHDILILKSMSAPKRRKKENNGKENSSPRLKNYQKNQSVILFIQNYQKNQSVILFIQNDQK
jgi:hypothetical protein